MEKVLFADTFTKTFKDILKVPPVVIDDPIFRLHYKFTGLALLFASILVSGYQFFGDPIKCIQRDDIPERVLETYCWIEGTFTLPKALSKKVGTDVVYLGVDKHDEGDEVIEHAYYQWVCFLLFFQAIIFCFPYLVWRAFESGKLLALIQKLRSPVVESAEREKSYKNLTDYFVFRKKEHNAYCLKYFFCEILNFVNVVSQIFLVNKFLGGQFLSFGTDVFKYANEEQENRVDPMIRIFPRVTKCTFHKFGSSGDVQKHDALCLLPLNIINEKIFIVMWFWFVVLAILSGLLLFYRALGIFSSRFQFILLKCVSNLTSESDINHLIPRITYGDWFVLYLLAGNIDNLHFRAFILKLKSSPRFMKDKACSIPDFTDSGVQKSMGVHVQTSISFDEDVIPVKQRVRQIEDATIAFTDTEMKRRREKQKEAEGEEIPLMTQTTRSESEA